MTAIKKISFTLPALIITIIIYLVLSLTLDAQWQPLMMPLATLLAYAFAIDHSRKKFGWPHTLLFLCLTTVVSLIFESIGVATGWIFGAYSYTEHLGAKFRGLVPIIIPLAWFMVSYPSLVIAMRLAHR